MSEDQVKASAERRLAEVKADARTGSYARAPQVENHPLVKDGQLYYSRNAKDGSIHQFFDVNSDLTFQSAHVHVIHDETNDEVRLHVSLGNSDRHSEQIALVRATPREIDAAVDLLAGALRDRMR